MYDSLILIWGIWAQSSQIVSMSQILYNRLPSDDLETWVRRHLMGNIKLKTLGYLYVSIPMTWGIWAQFPEIALMSQIPSSMYNFSLELPLGVNSAWIKLIRYLGWRMWFTFCVSITMIDVGFWVHNYSESQKILTFLLGFPRWRIRQTLRKHEDFRKSSYTSVYIFSYTSGSNKKLMQIKHFRYPPNQ